MTKIIIANIICAIAYLILIMYTILNTSRKTILICNIIISILFGIQYYMLDAITAAFSSLFGVVMYSSFFFKGKNKFMSTPIVPILCGIGYVIIGIVTWENWFSILPMMATILSVIGMWLDKEVSIKGFNIPVSVCWIIYNVYCLAYAGIVGQSILLIMDFVFMYLYFKKYRYENEAKVEK